MVDGLHRKVKGHEFDDWTKPAHCGACPNPCKAIFCNRRIDNAARAKFIEQALRDFVSALIFGNFLTHDKHAVIAAHFFRHCVT